MSITQTITVLPTAPQRSDPDNFSERMDDFLEVLENTPTEINTWGTQANSLATTVNSDADRAEAAGDIIAAAGNMTIYAAGTTYAAGDIVQDPNDSYQIYLSQQDSNSGHTPSSDDGTWWELASPSAQEISDNADAIETRISKTLIDAKGDLLVGSADDTPVKLPVGTSGQYLTPDSSETTGVKWTDLPPGGRSGTTEVSSAVDITLTSSSDFIQFIEMTAALKSVILPDATTMAEGLAFIIRATGYDIFVKDSGGNVLFLSSGNDLAVMLIDNSTSDGTWRVLNDDAGVMKLIAGDEQSTSLPTSTPQIAVLTPNKILVCYRVGWTDGRAVILSISEDTISEGTYVTFHSSDINYVRVSAISAEKAIILFEPSSSNDLCALILSISGTTITVGSIATITTNNPNMFAIEALSDDKAVAIYVDNDDSKYGKAVVLSISGTTITVGTIFTFHNTANTLYMLELVALAEDKVFALYNEINSPKLAYAVILSISGTTITKGGAKVIIDISPSSAYPISRPFLRDDGTVLFTVVDPTSYPYSMLAYLVEVSGSDINIISSIVAFEVSTSSHCLSQLSNDVYVVETNDGSTALSGVITVHEGGELRCGGQFAEDLLSTINYVNAVGLGDDEHVILVAGGGPAVILKGAI